jgi:hypothetical protein
VLRNFDAAGRLSGIPAGGGPALLWQATRNTRMAQNPERADQHAQPNSP